MRLGPLEIVLILVLALVLFGGIKRIGAVAEDGKKYRKLSGRQQGNGRLPPRRCGALPEKRLVPRDGGLLQHRLG